MEISPTIVEYILEILEPTYLYPTFLCPRVSRASSLQVRRGGVRFKEDGPQPSIERPL